MALRVEYASGLESDDPRCVVTIIGCTGDWFGGWDGLTPGSVDRLISADLSRGRLVKVIDREEPAIMVCHWPGIYYNGDELGFRIFKEAVRRVHAKYEKVRWMKLSEISRYWAAKALSRLDLRGRQLSVNAPFACRDDTLRLDVRASSTPGLGHQNQRHPLREVRRSLDLGPNTWMAEGQSTLLCFDLQRGRSTLYC